MPKWQRLREERRAANARAMRNLIRALLDSAHQRLDDAERHMNSELLYEARQDCGDVIELVTTARDNLTAILTEERDGQPTIGRDARGRRVVRDDF